MLVRLLDDLVRAAGVEASGGGSGKSRQRAGGSELYTDSLGAQEEWELGGRENGGDGWGDEWKGSGLNSESHSFDSIDDWGGSSDDGPRRCVT